MTDLHARDFQLLGSCGLITTITWISLFEASLALAKFQHWFLTQCRGFINSRAPGKLTGCEQDFNLPSCFRLPFLLSFIRKTKNAQLKIPTDPLHKNLMKPLTMFANNSYSLLNSITGLTLNGFLSICCFSETQLCTSSQRFGLQICSLSGYLQVFLQIYALQDTHLSLHFISLQSAHQFSLTSIISLPSSLELDAAENFNKHGIFKPETGTRWLSRPDVKVWFVVYHHCLTSILVSQ